MITIEQQSGWAGNLLEFTDDQSTPTGTVVTWIQSNLGLFGSYIDVPFTLDEESSIEPEMTPVQSGLYNEMYLCYHLNKQARKLVGAMAYDWIEIDGEDQGKVRRVSNTEKGKFYRTLAKDCSENFNSLIKTYKGGNYAIPRQSLFSERSNSSFHNSCECFEFNPNNPCLLE
jgi:hypothetical protein